MDMSHIVIPSNNLLVLALSTFNKNMSETTYKCPDEERNFKDGKKIVPSVKGNYQLEPVLKYLQQTIGVHGVLLIKTKETQKEQPISYTWTDENDVAHHVERTVSPETLFREMIADVAGDIDVRDCLLSEGDVATQKDIDAILDQIRGYCKDHDGTRIYMDLHGGPRANAQLMTAIISLLPLENTEETTASEGIRVRPEDIYSVIFDITEPENDRIIRAGSSYGIMDLVAGVHEFVEYGRTESLKRYADRHADVAGMVAAMDTISDALAMADIQSFDKGLRELKKEIDRLTIQKGDDEANGGDTSELLLRLIDQEYGKIIKSTSKQIDKIRWCVEKKFYQLAITMCESQIPWYIKERGVFDFEAAIDSGYGQDGHGDTVPERFLAAFNFFVTSYNEIERNGKVYYQMYKYRDSKYYYLECDKADSEVVGNFLELHSNIKETRNIANHLSSFANGTITNRSGRVITIYQNTEQLNDGIDEYLRAVKALRNSGLHLELKISDHPAW